MAKIKVKLVRSRIGTTPHQRKLLDSLGLRKTQSEREFNDTPAIRGIIAKVPHMVTVTEA
ncbi:MAG: 50S ribosomal protein L30 [Desulfovibrio sp.]|nr:50S ribosomal protein L30 [Desulfovibrio sp.]